MYETQNRNDDEPVLKQGLPTYRIAQGKILRGREEEGTLQEIPQLIGTLLRVGIHHGTTKDGTAYAKLEAELDTSKYGRCSVSTNLSSMMSTLTFAEGLLGCKKGEKIGVAAAQSAKKNRYGSYTTYANVYRIVNGEALPVKNKIGGQDEKLEDNVSKALELIEAHEAYSERPKRVSDEDVAESGGLALEIAKALKWPSPGNHNEAYMKACEQTAKFLKVEIKKPYKSWADVPSSVIDKLREWHEQNKMPAALKDLPVPTADDYDPFADTN